MTDHLFYGIMRAYKTDTIPMKIQCDPPLILASESPARRLLLEQSGVPFTMQASSFDEEGAKEQIAHWAVPEQSRYLAHGKAKVVSADRPGHLVLAADQIASFHDEAIFKPMTERLNIDLLCKLSGQVHAQHSSACLYLNGECLQDFYECIKMHMHRLSRDSCRAYVKADQPMRCCAGYRFEGRGRLLFSMIEGSTEGVMGLPLMPILSYLHKEGHMHWA